jgi:hypothetical protein
LPAWVSRSGQQPLSREKDPAKPETVEGWRGVPAILFSNMTNITQRENRTWDIIPSGSGEQQFSIFRGAHSWKFGVVYNLRRGGSPDTTNAGFNFQTLDDILRNAPSSVEQITGQPQYTWSMPSLGLYGQDDWRVSRRLVLNLGLRYDRYSAFNPKARYSNQPAGLFNLDGLLDSVNFIWGPLRAKPFDNDNLNLGPRVGFAYTADRRGDFVVRGGFGVSFAGYDASHFGSRVARDPKLPFTVTFSRAEATRFGLKYPAYSEDMVPVVLSQNRPAQPESRYDPHLKSPYAMNYTLGIQRALSPTMVLETAFVGTRGVKFNMVRDANVVDRVTGIRPNPNDIQVRYVDNSQQTNYNSWQTSLKQRLTRGLAFNVHHTWGKALSYTGGDIAHFSHGDARSGVIQDFNELDIERSLSTGDATHSVSADWVYQAPTPFADSSIARQVLGGWELAGIWKARTGLPLGISQTGGRPDMIDGENAVNKKCCSFGNLQYLNAAAFQRLAVPTASGRTIRRGNINSTPLRGPGAWNIDLSMGKTFKLSERKGLEFKADMLNVLNHTNYTGISTNLTGIDFGLANATSDPRVIQLQLRLAF